jgi:hypothetical protein
MSDQPPLFAPEADANLVESLTAENARHRRTIKMFLQNYGSMAFCKTKYVEGRPAGPGCGREVFFCTFKGDRKKCLNEDGSTHRCPEIKP